MKHYIVLILVFGEIKWKDVVKLLQAYGVTQWFYQLYSLYYQDVPENLIWCHSKMFFRGDLLYKVIKRLQNILNHDLDSDVFWKI